MARRAVAGGGDRGAKKGVAGEAAGWQASGEASTGGDDGGQPQRRRGHRRLVAEPPRGDVPEGDLLLLSKQGYPECLRDLDCSAGSPPATAVVAGRPDLEP